jgi:2-iminobutanoate/2-iminopropanoate deaminase
MNERWRPWVMGLAAGVVGAAVANAVADVPAPVRAQAAATTRTVVAPAGFPKTGLPYSPGILAGDTLYLSGQLGRDPATAKLVPGGIEAETRQALANLRVVLRAAGMDYEDVVSVTAFIRSLDDFEAYNRAYREHFAVDPPARATVQVAGLNLGAAIELQMVAVRTRR